MLTEPRLQELLASFPSLRIGVLGDFFLDKYLECDPILVEVSLETGRSAHQVVATRHSPGAAGNVVKNLAALGAGTVVPIGFTGDDGEGYELRRDLTAFGCTAENLLLVKERHTPLYLKPRQARVDGLAGESERYDRKNRRPLPPDTEQDLIRLLHIALPQLDALVISDQVEEEERGVVTTTVRHALAALAEEFPRVVFWTDSRRRSRLFARVILKPNQFEAVQAAFPGQASPVTEQLVQEAGRALQGRTQLPVFLTRAERGLLIFDRGGVTEVPAVTLEGPTDPTGAGDSATAGAVLTLASGGELVEAGLVANLAASLAVQQLGVTGSASPDLLLPRLALWRQQRLPSPGE